MWIYISAIAKTVIFSTQNRGGNISQIIFCKNIHNHCRKHRKFAKFVILHNRIQISEKFSPIISKLAFSQVPQQCSTNKRKLLTHKIIKAAIICSHVYCEGIYGKGLQTRTILFKCTIVVTGVRRSTNISAQDTKQIILHILTITTKTYQMAHSSHTKSSVSIDLFNLPPLPDMRKHATMICEIPNNFCTGRKEHTTK